MDSVNRKTSGAQWILLTGLCLILPALFCPKLSDVFNLPKLAFLKMTIILMVFPVIYRAVSRNHISYLPFPFFIPACAFLAVLLFAGMVSPYPFLSFQEFIIAISFMTTAYLVFHYGSLPLFIDVLTALMLSTFLVSLYAILQHMGIDPVSWDDPNIRIRSTSTLGNPDFLGAYLAMAFPLLLALTLATARPALKMLYILFLLALFTALMFTFSRGAWLCFAVSLAAFLLLCGKSTLRKNTKTLIILFSGTLMLFHVISKEKIVIDKKETTASERLASTVQMSYPSIAIRRHLWHDTLHMIREKPFTGYGPGNYTFFFPPFRSPELLTLAGRLNLPESAHNDYLQNAVDAGMFAFFAFAWLFICVFIYALKKRKSSGEKIYLAGITASLLAFGIENMFYYHVASTYLLFFLCAGALPLLTLSNQENEEQRRTILLPFTPVSKRILKICIPLLGLALIVNIFSPVAADYYFRKGTSHLEKKQFEKAELSLLLAKNLAPREKTHGAYLGKCYEEMAVLMSGSGKKFTAEKKRFFLLALNEYRDIVKMYPNLAFVYADMGRLFLEMFLAGADKNGIEASIRHYEKALSRDPQNSMLCNDVGRVHLARLDFKKARASFEKAIALEPGYADAYANLGLIDYTEKKTNEARMLFLRALEADPSHFDSLARLGVIAYESKKYYEAMDYFQRASKIRPEDKLLPQKIKELQNRIRKP